MIRFYLLIKIFFFFGYLEEMGWLLLSDLPLLLCIDVILFISYMFTLYFTKGKRQVTLILLIHCIGLPTGMITAYLRYNDWLFLLVGFIAFSIVCIYLMMLRNEIEYLQ